MAPKANLIIVSGEAEAVVMRINELTIEHREKGEKVGIICTDESRAQYIGDVIESIGSRQDVHSDPYLQIPDRPLLHRSPPPTYLL